MHELAWGISVVKLVVIVENTKLSVVEFKLDSKNRFSNISVNLFILLT